jgi:FkbM family methyltransferase
MIRTITKRILRPVLGKVGTQTVYKAMYRLALLGMNYIDAGVLSYSGEQQAFEHVIKTLADRYPSNAPVTVFDVGANIGKYSLMASPRLLCKFPAGHIHAFEPSASTCRQLTSNVNGNDSITVHKLALGDEPGESTLYQIVEGSGYASLYDRENGSLAKYGLKTTITEKVQLATIDTFCLENNITRIHFLKIDAEGHEFSVLKGANSMLESGAIDAIQFEFSEGCLDSRTFFKDFFDLLGHRYRISRILRNGLYPLPKYTEDLEIFSTSNFLAERDQERN